MRPLLHDEVDFVGALGATHGVDQTLAGLGGMFAMTDRVDVVKRWVDGPAWCSVPAGTSWSLASRLRYDATIAQAITIPSSAPAPHLTFWVSGFGSLSTNAPVVDVTIVSGCRGEVRYVVRAPPQPDPLLGVLDALGSMPPGWRALRVGSVG